MEKVIYTFSRLRGDGFIKGKSGVAQIKGRDYAGKYALSHSSLGSAPAPGLLSTISVRSATTGRQSQARETTVLTPFTSLRVTMVHTTKTVTTGYPSVPSNPPPNNEKEATSLSNNPKTANTGLTGRRDI